MRGLPHLIFCLLVISNAVALGRESADVKTLQTMLQSGDAQKQIEAAQQLSRMGSDAAPAVPALSEALTATDDTVRIEAARALSFVGPDASSAIPALTERLREDDSALVRAYAAYALGNIGAASKKAASELMKVYEKEQNETVRRAIRIALRRIGLPDDQTAPVIAGSLKSAESAAAMPAMETLLRLGDKAAPYLRKALKQPNASYWACLVATKLGPEVKELVPEIADVLNHQDPEARMQAALALGEMRSAAKSALPRLTEVLQTDRYSGIKYAATYAIGRIGPDSTATRAIVQNLDAEDAQLQAVSAWALLRSEPDVPEFQEVKRKLVAIVIEALSSDDPQTREIAARTLADIDPDAAPSKIVADALLQALKDDDPAVLTQVVDGLVRRGGEAAPQVIKALDDEKLRPMAIEILGQIGAEAKEAVPELTRLLRANRDNKELVREIQYALGRMGPAAASATDELIRSLKSENRDVRYSASYALGKIGAEAEAAADELRSLLDDEDEFARLTAHWTLLRVQPDDEQLKKEAVPVFTQALSDGRPHVRRTAVRGLGALGKVASESLPELRKRLNDPSQIVQQAAKKAIEKIEGTTESTEDKTESAEDKTESTEVKKESAADKAVREESTL